MPLREAFSCFCSHERHHSLRRIQSLTEMPRGCKMLVENLAGNPAIRSKLYSMGIVPGTELELCQHDCGKGCVNVRVRGCSLVLDKNTAQIILCRSAHKN